MSKKTLEIFNEKVSQMERFSFVSTLLDNPEAVKFELRNGNASLETNGPGEEATAAFAMIFRQFIQNNDPISIGNMAVIYTALQIPQELRDEFSAHRKNINDFLDSDASGFQLSQGPITKRHLIDTILYGGLAHSTGSKRQEYEEWRANQLIFAVQTAAFNVALARVLRSLQAIRDLNLRVMPHL